MKYQWQEEIALISKMIWYFQNWFWVYSYNSSKHASLISLVMILVFFFCPWFPRFHWGFSLFDIWYIKVNVPFKSCISEFIELVLNEYQCVIYDLVEKKLKSTTDVSEKIYINVIFIICHKRNTSVWFVFHHITCFVLF